MAEYAHKVLIAFRSIDQVCAGLLDTNTGDTMPHLLRLVQWAVRHRQPRDTRFFEELTSVYRIVSEEKYRESIAISNPEFLKWCSNWFDDAAALFL